MDGWMDGQVDKQAKNRLDNSFAVSLDWLLHVVPCDGL